MATKVKEPARAGSHEAYPDRSYPDLHEHVVTLKKEGLLTVVDRPINKDRHMHPLVRWQFRGGIDEADRKAFMFTHPVDAKGGTYDIPVLIGALAANPKIYSVGMGCTVEEIPAKWVYAVNNPVEPRLVDRGPCQEIVISGAELTKEGKGLDALPVPISSPGWDNAPYTAAGVLISKDPENGIQNAAIYRGQIKARNRIGTNTGEAGGGAQHWRKYKARGQPMPVALVIGVPPAVTYSAVQKVAANLDEVWVAGAVAGSPINVVKAKTVDLLIPAETEIVIEGLVPTDMLEPEGPFGESHGYVNLQAYKQYIDVTAITRRSDAMLLSFISQVTPSESSMIKRTAYEPLFLDHLTSHLGIKGVKYVYLHEPLTGARPLVIVQVEKGMPVTEVWRTLYGASAMAKAEGRWIVAVNEDIDPKNSDAVFWAMCSRCQAQHDVQILPHKNRGHGMGGPRDNGEVASVLIDATLKEDYPPLALPKKEFMEEAREIWEELDLPPLRPQSPWHGFTLGDWSEELERQAQLAVKGDYWETGKLNAQFRRSDVGIDQRVDRAPDLDDD